MRYLSAAILAVALAAGAGAADPKSKKDDPNQIGNRDVGKCLNFYSAEKEVALGRQLALEVERQRKLDDDPILSEYVNRVGQNLARNSDAKVPFTFRVISGDEVNAFALPGGFVFVYTGLLKVASDEDEFAGALAHEIAHVAARHMTCQMSKEQLSRAIGSLPGGLGGMAVRRAIPMTFPAFSRHDETEADYLGVQYMYAAGYDPAGAVSIFEKLESMQRSQPGAVARLFATHPSDSERIDRTEKEIQAILPARAEYVVTTSEYTAVRERLLARDGAAKPGDGDKPVLRVPPGDKPSDGRPNGRRRDFTD
jgi:predicted Zn-dependent protease